MSDYVGQPSTEQQVFMDLSPNLPMTAVANTPIVGMYIYTATDLLTHYMFYAQW